MAKIESIGDKLRSIREDAGLGIKTVGRELEISYSHISKIENGHKVPSPELLQKLAHIYGIDPEVLLAQIGVLPPDIREILATRGEEVFDLIRNTFNKSRKSK